MSVTYTLRYRPVAAENSTPGQWTEVSRLAGTSHALTGLSAGLRYEVEVEAVSSAGVRSSALVAQRSTVCVAPVQPSVLPAGYVLSSGDPGTNGGLAASWGAVTGAQSYRVRHRTAAVGGTATGDWGELGVEATSRGVTGLDGSVSYDVEVAAVNVDGDVSAPSVARTGVPARIASGGTVTAFADVGGGATYIIHSFTSAGSLLLNRDLNDVEHLLVGGGGGGGFDAGGGGGGGAVIQNVGSAATRAVETYPVVVGVGGNASTTTGTNIRGQTGGVSSVFGIDAAGGGGGGSKESTGNSGASGGGGGHNGSNAGGTGSPGGNGGASSTDFGGGGGGAATGGQAASGTGPGSGGDGASSLIRGTESFFGGGGGGGRWATADPGGAGGQGGGGRGGNGYVSGGSAVVTLPAEPGEPATGGGGGGGGRNNSAAAAGASGIVVVRYWLPA